MIYIFFMIKVWIFWIFYKILNQTVSIPQKDWKNTFGRILKILWCISESVWTLSLQSNSSIFWKITIFPFTFYDLLPFVIYIFFVFINLSIFSLLSSNSTHHNCCLLIYPQSKSSQVHSPIREKKFFRGQKIMQVTIKVFNFLIFFFCIIIFFRNWLILS